MGPDEFLLSEINILIKDYETSDFLTRKENARHKERSAAFIELDIFCNLNSS